MRATDRQAVQLSCLLDGSRMSREVHVRFCERLGVQPPRAYSPGVARLIMARRCHAVEMDRR